MPERTCTKCGVAKPHDQFTKLARYRDGLHPHCRACHKAHRDEYRSRPEVRLAERERGRAYEARPEVRERKRKAHRDRKRALRATEEGRAKNAATVKAWRERNPETSRQRIRLAHQKRKAAKMGNDSRRVTTAEAKRILSQACVNCGSSEHIQIDHIIPLSRGGRHAIGNLQPLCSFCNLSKNNSLQIEWRYRQRQLVEVSRDR